MSRQENLRNQILNESIKILGSQGFEGLSLRGVAKKLKVTHQAPYHYFADKGALLIELKKEGFSLLNERMKDALRGREKGFDMMEGLGLTYFDFCIENPGYFRAMFAPTLTGEGIRVPEAQESFSTILSCIHQLQREGYLQNYNPDVITMICWTTMHGYVSLALDKYPVMGGKYDVRELAGEMVKTLHSLYGKPAGS